MRLRWLPVLIVALALPARAAVDLGLRDGSQFERDFDADTVTWQEIEAQLPALPKAENLVAFTVDLRPGYAFALDRKSLSVGGDGVVRYTVVITSPAGARTVNFEGMRCENGERKIYAFGRSDGTWSKNRGARWDPIQARMQDGYHRTLFFEFLCAGGEGVPTVARIEQRLRQGGHRAD